MIDKWSLFKTLTHLPNGNPGVSFKRPVAEKRSPWWTITRSHAHANLFETISRSPFWSQWFDANYGDHWVTDDSYIFISMHTYSVNQNRVIARNHAAWRKCSTFFSTPRDWHTGGSHKFSVSVSVTPWPHLGLESFIIMKTCAANLQLVHADGDPTHPRHLVHDTPC